MAHPAKIAFYDSEDEVTKAMSRQDMTIGERNKLVEHLRHVAMVSFTAYIDCAVRK